MTGDAATELLRELETTVANFLYENPAQYDRASLREQARDLLALPSVRRLLADRLAVQRVTEALDDAETRHSRHQMPLFDGYMPPAQVTVDRIRRALGGAQ